MFHLRMPATHTSSPRLKISAFKGWLYHENCYAEWHPPMWNVKDGFKILIKTNKKNFENCHAYKFAQIMKCHKYKTLKKQKIVSIIPKQVMKLYYANIKIWKLNRQETWPTLKIHHTFAHNTEVLLPSTPNRTPVHL